MTLWYRVRLTLRGPTGTPWQADTIFGHLCWALRHQRGEAALKDFLDYYRNDLPPLLVSDGFPGDLLPRPLTFALPYSEDRETFRKARELRKLRFLKLGDFQRAIGGEVFEPSKVEDSSSTRVTLKNQVNRLTGTTGDGGQLFGFREHWTPSVTIYGKVETGFEAEAKDMFGWLAKTGYGKRKSVGYGAIDSIKWDEDWKGFPAPAGANAFVTLSPFIPAATDPTDGRWRVRVKYGRLGEDYSVEGNPFKRPLVMLETGAVFRAAPVKEFYGRMVGGVSGTHPEVVHYAYALPVPMHLPGAGKEAEE